MSEVYAKLSEAKPEGLITRELIPGVVFADYLPDGTLYGVEVLGALNVKVNGRAKAVCADCYGVALASIEARLAYYRNHEACPQCGGTDRSETTMGCMVGFDPEAKDTKDTNRVRCRCGWTGIVDELVALPPQIS